MSQETQDSSEEEHMSDEEFPAVASMPSRRSTRAKPVQEAMDDESFDGLEESEKESNDSHSDDESVDSYEDAPPKSRKARGTRSSSRKTEARTQSRSSPRAKRTVITKSTNSPGTRKSNRKRSRLNSSYEELSDFEPEDEYEDSESEEEPITNSRGRNRKVHSYAEEPSDVDEDEDSYSEDDRKARGSRTKRKRQGKIAASSPKFAMRFCFLTDLLLLVGNQSLPRSQARSSEKEQACTNSQTSSEIMAQD
jgi:hypothetical protein